MGGGASEVVRFGVAAVDLDDDSCTSVVDADEGAHGCAVAEADAGGSIIGTRRSVETGTNGLDSITGDGTLGEGAAVHE